MIKKISRFAIELISESIVPFVKIITMPLCCKYQTDDNDGVEDVTSKVPLTKSKYQCLKAKILRHKVMPFTI